MSRLGLVAVLLVVTTIALPNVGYSQAITGMDFEAIANQSFERASERLDGTDIIVKRLENAMMQIPAPPGAGACATGNCIAEKNESGIRRLLTLTEVQVLAGLTPDAGEMYIMGETMIEAQDMMNEGMAAEMNAADPRFGALADTLLNGPPGASGLPSYMNPFEMIAQGGSMMILGAIEIGDATNRLEQGEEIARAQAEARQALVERSEYTGVVDINGTPAHEFVVNDINQTVSSEGGDTFTMQTGHMYFDTEELVMLRYRIDGFASQGGQETPFYIETENADFRHVPGSNLYEPYATVTRMGGMLDEEQQAQLEEARVQLEEFERQLAAMPADQRAMAERMMGGQMDMIRGMANSGALEFTQKVAEIYVNPDLAALYGASETAGTAADGGAAAPAGGNLVARIQTDLQELGYDPGNVDGELTTQTVIAISQFQAEKGFEVTGEATEALASALAEALGR